MTEKIQQMQQDLEKRGVKFLPWIGEKYEDGIYYNEKGELRYGDNKGEKLLIVSEGIHMDETYKDAFNCVGKEELSYLIYKIIERFIDPQSNFHYGINHRSFIQFERALAGTVQLRLSKRAELWNHVAFYTYIQEPLDSAKLIPTEEQYAKSYDSFKDVIATYKPDIIILWGNRLYNNLCPKEQESQYILIDDYYIEMQILSINNLNVKLLPIWHPSYIGFRHDDWHKIIVEAIKNGN